MSFAIRCRLLGFTLFEMPGEPFFRTRDPLMFFRSTGEILAFFRCIDPSEAHFEMVFFRV
jgi:hypothetical protein